MCGIVGYLGSQDAVSVLMKGLKTLEYRGYDSAGVAYLSEGTLKVHKKMGRIAVLDDYLGTQQWQHPDRDRPHPLGDPRAAFRPQRPPPFRLHA